MQADALHCNAWYCKTQQSKAFVVIHIYEAVKQCIAEDRIAEQCRARQSIAEQGKARLFVSIQGTKT